MLCHIYLINISVETMSYYTDTGKHKMKSILSNIRAFLTALQKAQVAAHFARTGKYEKAQKLMQD